MCIARCARHAHPVPAGLQHGAVVAQSLERRAQVVACEAREASSQEQQQEEEAAEWEGEEDRGHVRLRWRARVTKVELLPRLDLPSADGAQEDATPI